MSICRQCKTTLREGDRFCFNCGASIPPPEAHTDPMIGRTIGRAYLVLELIGVGGMGRVYRAEQRALGRTVAIKFIHQHLLSDEQIVARFYTEARAASRLNHPNSVGIIDFGRTEDEILYLVMEYLRGKDLAMMINEGVLPIPRIVDIILGVLSALSEAHELGVIHRDLKPENVFVERTRTGRDLVKVVDFGLAKLREVEGRSQSLTQPGLMCGTPDYISPEQGRGEQADGRSDIYSIGVLLFELLAERLPFIADTPTNLIIKHIQEAIPDPRQIAPHRMIPQRIAEITMRAMAKNPAERFQKADEMAEALREALEETQAHDENSITCFSCGTVSSKKKRFCGECGAPLVTSPSIPARRPSVQTRVSLPGEMPRALLGREEELSRINRCREETQNRMVTFALVGESGVGKTRLLVEAAEAAISQGDLVVHVGPHDSGAPVSYWPVLQLLCSLYSTDLEGLKGIVPDSAGEYVSLAEAGLRETVEPEGLRGSDGKSRAGAVACSLATGIRVALGRERAERVVIIVDDLDRCDGLTRSALRQLYRFTESTSVFLLVACQNYEPRWFPGDVILETLQGISAIQAAELLGDAADAKSGEKLEKERLVLPLYIEQLRRLGFSLHGGETGEFASRLADLVAQRVQRLHLSARLLLQSAAILGYRCSRSELIRLTGEEKFNGA